MASVGKLEKADPLTNYLYTIYTVLKIWPLLFDLRIKVIIF